MTEVLKPGDPGHTEVSAEQRAAELESREKFRNLMRAKQIARDKADELCRITKEIVLAGLSYRRHLQIGPDYLLTIRPITDAEFNEAQDVILSGLKRANLDDPNYLIEIKDRERRGKLIAVAYGLSCDGQEWTTEEVEKLPAGRPDELYAHLGEISGFPAPPVTRAGGSSSEPGPTP